MHRELQARELPSGSDPLERPLRLSGVRLEEERRALEAGFPRLPLACGRKRDAKLRLLEGEAAELLFDRSRKARRGGPALRGERRGGRAEGGSGDALFPLAAVQRVIDVRELVALGAKLLEARARVGERRTVLTLQARELL